MVVRRLRVSLPLLQPFPVEPSLPRGFSGGPAVADGAASIFAGLMLATGGEHSSPVVRVSAGSSEECTDPRAGAEKCEYIYLNAVLDEDAILLSIDVLVDFMHVT